MKRPIQLIYDRFVGFIVSEWHYLVFAIVVKATK